MKTPFLAVLTLAFAACTSPETSPAATRAVQAGSPAPAAVQPAAKTKAKAVTPAPKDKPVQERTRSEESVIKTETIVS